MNDEIKVWVMEFVGRPNYHLQWKDPVTQRRKTKVTKIPFTGKARERKLAEREARELENRLAAGEAVIPSKMTWQEFRRRYEAEVVPGLARRTAEKICSVLDRFEREIGLQRLWDANEKRLSAFVSQLREGDRSTGKGKLAESTIAGHLAHLKAAMNWAKGQKLLPQTPTKYPASRFSSSGNVVSSRESGDENRVMRAATGERPVISAARDGTHCGAAVKKRWNLIPSAASWSRAGVFTFGSP